LGIRPFMSLYLKPTTGPQSGQTFKVEEGLTLGRSKADIPLKDSKISSIHAIIQVSPNGHFELVDQNSKNGLWTDEKQVERILLKEGVQFRVGRVHMVVERQKKVHKVNLTDDATVTFSKNQAQPSQPLSEEAPGQNIALEPLHWSENLMAHIEELLATIKNKPRALAPFSPPIKLRFVRGVQAPLTWTLGYGPRRIGSASVDLPIHELGAPNICFELLPTTEGLLFKTNSPQQVKLNGHPVSSELLKSGDEISISKTFIRVDLLHGLD